MSHASDRPPPASAEPDLSGRQIGDYRLLRRLGRGAMAEVYLAEQASLRRQVAFKALKSSLATDATYVQRFQLEAQAAASLTHANIVQIHEVGCVDGVQYIAQEYVQGQNLRDFITRNGPPEVKLALTILRGVAAALHKAAEQGIVHRDIKPENIMLSRSGEVKVADFGLARLAGDNTLNLTQVGMTMGTPLYMSPEQVEGRPLDPRSDIYSLGVTAYHMLTGQPPFRGETALSVALQHLKVQPPPLDALRPDLPPGLCRIVHKMLSKEPDNRYATARDLLKDLRALRAADPSLQGDDDDEWASGELAAMGSGGLEATSRLAALMRTETLRAVPRRRWQWLLLAAALVGAFLLGGGLALGTREPYLLSGVDASSLGISRMASAATQYRYAELVRTDEAWQAVIRYWPDDKKFAPQAKQELAWAYLMHSDHAAAMELFTELANMSEIERRYRAYGLAGQALVLHLDGDPAASAAKLAEVSALLGDLRPERITKIIDSRTMQMVGLVAAKNRQVADDLTRQQWRGWVKENLAEEADLAEPVDKSGPAAIN